MVRGSLGITAIGVKSDRRPHTLSAALGNECGNPTRERVATFRQTLLVTADS
jgi:hypothetical protein